MGDFCVQDGQKFLMIGDSITDAGRRDVAAPFGAGYVASLRGLVIGRWPERRITWVNQGIGGNKVTDLRDRWEDDVMRAAPDWLSVKIGINDVHSHLMNMVPNVSPAVFRETYHDILTRTTTSLKCGLILITPFYVSADRSGQSWRSQVLDILPAYTKVVEDMAQEFGARLVRLQPMFDQQMRYRPADEFAPEPVHPYPLGHLLMAQEILRVMCE